MPLPAAFDLDTLLAVTYPPTTDNSGCFSFHHYTFPIDSAKPVVKKPIVFLFSEKTGFKAYYDKVYYEVKFLDFLNKDKRFPLPQVTGRLIYDCSFSGVKTPELLGMGVN